MMMVMTGANHGNRQYSIGGEQENNWPRIHTDTHKQFIRVNPCVSVALGEKLKETVLGVEIERLTSLRGGDGAVQFHKPVAVGPMLVIEVAAQGPPFAWRQLL